MIRRPLAIAAITSIACVAFASCAAPSAPVTPAQPTAEVVVLFTSDEHGWLLAHTEKGRSLGGAAETLAQWVAHEGHCPGPPAPPCENPRTLALSGGDNYTGPAISTFFEGVPMAEAFARMNYAASAFGNHELDFGRARFVELRKTSGITYLAANLHAPAAMKDMALPGYAIYERRGLKIGVVGVATDTTLQQAMAARFEGITFEAEEPALGRAIGDAWSAGADAVVAIVHECPDVLVPIVRKHPEWKLSFVGAGHCHKKMDERAGSVPVISTGWRLDRYLRVRIAGDPSRPRGERVLAVEPTVVEVSRGDGEAGALAPDPEIARSAAAWKEKVDRALGEEIGFVGADLDKGSAEIGRWITGAWRAELGADVAIVNRHGIRQGLAKGPITKASVWSVLPFDNKIVLLRMKGAALARSLGEDDVVAGGVWHGANGAWLVGGAPIDPERVYSVATIDFLYYGGHMGLKSALDAVDKGVDWRDPIIAWTKKKGFTKDKPIELELRELR
jgi:2',3'-cyclic-nucleotide 2'-phosphodiesterase (5'-nucleotidase family)